MRGKEEQFIWNRIRSGTVPALILAAIMIE